jgi:hypothetical protein
VARAKPSWHLEQGRFLSTLEVEQEVLLELTVPMSYDMDVFRVGWSLKGLRAGGWIAMSTGQAVWSRFELDEPAQHILVLLQTIADLVNGGVPEERR